MRSTYDFSRLQSLLMLVLLSAFITACGDRDEILGIQGNAALPPVVTSVNPAAGAVDVAVDIAAITATFDQPMQPLTGSASFTVTCAAPCTSPTGTTTLNAAGTTASFTPDAPLENSRVYTATVTGARSLATGLAMAAPFTWTFTTETTPLNVSVASTIPDDGGTIAVCPTTGISATFDVPLDGRLDPLTVNDLTFLIVEDANPANTVDASSVVVDEDTGTIATFTPQDLLTEGVTYRATLTGGPDGVKDLDGNQMIEDFVWTFTVVAPADPCVGPFDLASAAPFGTFGGSAGVTNQGLLTVINGDLGTTGASTLVTGFVGDPECRYTVTPLNEGLVNGRIFTDAPTPPDGVDCTDNGTAQTKAVADQAFLDAQAAFIALSPAALPGGLDPGNDNLGGLTLAPGVYTAQSGAFLIEGDDLTLDGQGDLNAIWVFQMASTLSVGEAAIPRSVILINGAQDKNIFWQVTSAATINPSGGGTMKGTIISDAGVSFSTAGNVDIVTLDGRALSLTASVTMVNTIINVPAP